MAGVLLDMAVSVDGFVCGPGGADGGLYEWYFDPSDVSRPVVEELVETTGAIVLGRGAFGTGEDSGGWDDGPYRVPHFVVTHRPLPRLSKGPGNGMEFVAVPEGVAPALALAREAAGDRWATIGGGADVARQALAAGLVEEVQLHVVPVLLGGGVPLFGGSPSSGAEVLWSATGSQLTRTRVVDAPNVTHLRYRVERRAESQEASSATSA